MIAGDAYLPVTTNPSYVTATMPDDGSSVFPTALVMDEAADTNWEGGAQSFIDGLASDYSDMQVTLADGETPVPFGVEEFSQVSGSRQLVVHLGVPSLSAAVGTELLLWRGVAGGPFDDGEGVWSTSDGWWGRWGMGENAGTIHDSTSAGLNLTRPIGITCVDGKIGKAQKFNAAGAMSSSPQYINPAAGTQMCWWRPDVEGDGVAGVSSLQPWSPPWGWWEQVTWHFGYPLWGKYQFRVLGKDGWHGVGSSTRPAWWPEYNVWHHLVLRWNANSFEIFVDGEQRFTSPYVPPNAWDYAFHIGADPYWNTATNASVDEYSFHTIRRSADWISVVYQSQMHNAAFWSIGEEAGAAAKRYPAARRAQIYRLGPRLIAGGLMI